jgi:8-oxo-dGTP pyrophosphatase MutT (NUDIX family)
MPDRIYNMVRRTMEAHRKFCPPAVYMTILIEDPDEGYLWFRSKRGPSSLSLFPCSCLLTCDETADALLAMYGLPRSATDRKVVHLVSDQALFESSYAYVFVVVLSKCEITEYATADFELAPTDSCEPLPPVSRRLLHHLARGPLDRHSAIEPTSEALTFRDPHREEATKRLKQGNLCMPLITVNGLVVHVDGHGDPVAALLTRRSGLCAREPGKWYVPSGFVAGHESATQALAREVLEEANLDLSERDIHELLFILDPSHVESTWINWPLFYAASTTRRPEEFWRGSNEEVEDVRLFRSGELPPAEEMAFGHGEIIHRGLEALLARRISM